MIEILDYPFDPTKILRKKSSLKKQLLKKEDLLKKKIAILGGTTTNEIKEQLQLFLLKSNINAEFYECEYGQFFESVMFEDKALYDFNPDIVYIHVSLESLPGIENSESTSEEKANVEFSKLQSIWKKLHKDFKCEVIQDNFELPLFKVFGCYDFSSASSVNRTISILNEMINKSSMRNSFLSICDRNYLSTKMGLSLWKDYSLWLVAKYSLSYKGISSLCYSLSKIIESKLGITKKCLVLDLDNTLWGGVIGDDGLNGILLGKESAIGEAYLDFHSYIKKLKDRGIILAVCSKNNFENAKKGLEHPDSILKFDDFTVFKANWEFKSKNIYEIANEINIGLDSIVFIDDNAVERDLVRKEFEGLISVPEIGSDVTFYRDILDSSELFNISSLSQEDTKRSEYYKNDKERKEALSLYTNFDDYLRSLDMKAEVSFFNEAYIARITQLINKTNQFNLTTKRTSEEEMKNSIKEKSKISLYARLEDKFGDNGLVSVIQGTINKDTVTIDLWVMSCRVFNRSLENTVFNVFAKKARSRNINTIIGKYIPTKKNNIVSNLYEDLGFSIINTESKTLTYELDLSKYTISTNSNITLNNLL